VNVYLIEDYENGWCVLDTGLDTEVARSLWLKLFRGPLAGKRLSKIIVSHYHADHIGLAGWLSDQHSASVLMSLTTYLMYRDIQARGGSRDSNADREFFAAQAMPPELADDISSHAKQYLDIVSPLPATFTRLVSGDLLDLGGRLFSVISTDGHAPEQILLASEKHGLLFSADQIMERITPNISVDPKNPTGNPLGLYLRSLSLLERINYDPLVLAGHRRVFHGLHERIAELRSHHEERCELIRNAVQSRPLTVAEIVPILFPRPLNLQQASFAYSECLAHINYLVERQSLEWVDVTRCGELVRGCRSLGSRPEKQMP
jgi:glyoxylase-like metal-dependent hydrolase (beta-lactamase superfamily II)